MECFDYIIVGAGSAGSLLAERLSLRHRVLLLEAGSSGAYFRLPFTGRAPREPGDARIDWGFSTMPEPGLNGRILAYPRTRLLGGPSAAFRMIWLCGHAADFDGWRRQGLTGWGWEDVEPHFRRLERDAVMADPVPVLPGVARGRAGLRQSEILGSLREAAVLAGFAATEDFNLGDNSGVGFYRFAGRGMRRAGASRVAQLAGLPALLASPWRRRTLKIVTGAHAERLLIEAGRVIGVRWRRAGLTESARADGEVVLSAGAIGSPQLLMLSGIGPAEHLRAMGIKVMRDVPDIGGNLQDHLQLDCTFRLDPQAPDAAGLASGWHRLRMAARGFPVGLRGRSGLSPLGIFAQSRAGLAGPDLQFTALAVAPGESGHARPGEVRLDLSVCLLHPQSRGSVRLAGPEPMRHPRIRPNYLASAGDRRVAADAIRLARRIMAQAPLAQYRPQESSPGPEVGDGDPALIRAAGDFGGTACHPVGTVRMGCDARAPLDGDLRLRGIGGLRVVDASVMPTITGGHTYAPTMMIAARAAAMILGESPGKS